MKQRHASRQARANDSRVKANHQVNNQAEKTFESASKTPSAPASTAGSDQFALRFLKATAELDLLVIHEEEERKKALGDCTRLRIMHGALDVLLKQGGELLCDVKPGTAPPAFNFKPFGQMEVTHEVEMARHHICAEWKRCQAVNTGDALDGYVPSLINCILHHPGLVLEGRALDAISSGHNDLVVMNNASKEGKLDGRKLTGPELWLAKKMDSIDRAPLASFLSMIQDAETIFVEGSRKTHVSEAIRKILWGVNILGKVDCWLASL